MKNYIGKIVLQGIIIIFLLLSIIIFLSLILIDYDLIIDYIIWISGYPVEKHGTIITIITPWRLILLQVVSAGCVIFASLSLFFFNKLYSLIDKFIFYFSRSLKNIIRDVKTQNALVILIIPFIGAIYFSFFIPVSYDESYTYLLFTDKPFYYCMMFYPYPNNHVLHSLLTNLTDTIPFLPTLICLRLPALVSAFLAWIVGYSFVKRYYSEKVAMFVIGISSTLFMSIYYNFMARGYSLILLFFIISLYAAFNIIKNSNRKKDWLFFSISSILGFYVMPSFLYPYLILNVLILIYNYRDIKLQIIFNLILCVGVIALYAPIIIVDGIDTLISNQFVIPKSRIEVSELLFPFFRNVLQEIFSMPYYIVVLCIITAFMIAWKNNNRRVLTLWILFIVAPFLLLIAHSVIPFPRTFSYYAFIILFLIGISFQKYIAKLPIFLLLIGIFVIQMASNLNFINKIGPYETFNTWGKEINDFVLKEPNKIYYLGASYNTPNFEFELVTRGYNLGNITYDLNKNLSADTLMNYHYILIDADKDKTILRKPTFSNGSMNIYTE